MINLDKEVLVDAINTWGVYAQLIMAIEEMSELTKEITKWFRGKRNREEMAGEMADVIIMMEQLKLTFSITDDEINSIVEAKTERLKSRLRETHES